jgi:hypothetical protein
MNAQRRVGFGVFLFALMLSLAGRAQAQVMDQIPAEALAVLKCNNPDAIGAKVTALGQKLGVANFVPQLADPIGALKQQFNLKDGIDTKGEVAVAIFIPGEGETDPRFLVFVPVSDYAAFLKNLTNLKTEGELTTFNMPADADPIYAVNWGSYAVITPWKTLVAQKPAAGIKVAGAAAAQLQSNDIVMFVNVKAIAAKLLPQLLANKEQVMKQAEIGVPPNLLPASKATMAQIFNFAESVLKQGQAATIGLSLSEKGINFSAMAEFDPAASLGQTIASIKSSPEATLLAGLPSRKYLVYGGAQFDPAVSAKVFDDVVGPVQKALEGVDEAASVVKIMTAAKSILEGTNKITIGWAAPAADAKGPPAGQQVTLIGGDSKKVQAGVRELYQGAIDLMKLVPQGQGVTIQAEIKPDAKTVDGASLDQVTMQIKFDQNTPAGAQAAQVAASLFGPEGAISLLGPVSDQTFVSLTGDDEFLTGVVASAKKAEDTLGQMANVKAVSEQLPKNKVAVMYIAVDNIVMAGLKYAEQMGMAMPLKLPPDMQPIGFSLSTEGSALRADMHVSADLMGQLISTGFQVMQMMQGGAARPPAAPAPGQ